MSIAPKPGRKFGSLQPDLGADVNSAPVPAPSALPAQALPDTHVPCLDWIDSTHPRFICPHCNLPANKGVKKKSAYFIICYTDAQTNEVFRVTQKLADEIAVMLVTGRLQDGQAIVQIGAEFTAHDVVTADYGAVAVTNVFLAQHFAAFKWFPENTMLRFRMTAEWAGLEFLHYHPNTLLSAIDLEAQKHGFALEKLDELRKAMREAEAR